jgi:hypothetical protein
MIMFGRVAAILKGMTVSRLSQSDVDTFITQLNATMTGTLEKGPSLWVAGYRLWLTLLDDASPGQLRVRKLIMVILDEPRPATLPAPKRHRRSREWYSTSPDEDRWEEIDSDQVLTSAEVLTRVKAEFAGLAG